MSEDVEPVDPENPLGPKLLYLGKVAPKLATIAALTGRSQSEIVRKLFIEEMDRMPALFKPRMPVVEQKKVVYKHDRYYIGEELMEAMENFKRNTGLPKSLLIRCLIQEYRDKNPEQFKKSE